MSKANVYTIDKNAIVTGIDLGSRSIKIIVAQVDKRHDKPKILAAVSEECDGIINGNIVSTQDVALKIGKSINRIEEKLNINIRNVYIGISCSTIKNERVEVKTIVAKASNEVSEIDLEKLREEAEKKLPFDSPFEVLEANLSECYLDGKKLNRSAVGLIGSKLEGTYILSLIPRKTREDIELVFKELEIKPLDIIYNAYVSSIAITSKKERMYGISVLDIGENNSILTIYENDSPIVVKNMKLGGNDFTKDLSVGLGINIDEAEKIKSGKISQDKKEYRKILSIIDARSEDFAEIILNEIKKVNTFGKIHNGITISGGGANLSEMETVFRKNLNMPVQNGRDIIFESTEGILKDPFWVNAYSLTHLHIRSEGTIKSSFNNIISFIKQVFYKIAP